MRRNKLIKVSDRIVQKSFYSRHPVHVARKLLGQKIVRQLKDETLSGMVIETEAYLAQGDSANHAFRGRTSRNSVMFGQAGFSYIYFIYGRYNMLNVTTEKEKKPSAVLIRAVMPLEGIHSMTQLKPGFDGKVLDGPGKICQAMAIDRSLNELDVTAGHELWFEKFAEINDVFIVETARIGIQYARPEDRRAPLRFCIRPDAIQRFKADQQESIRGRQPSDFPD